MSRSLVLLHGFTGGPGSWDEVLRRPEPPRDVLTPTLLGHDGSPGPADVGSFEDEVDRLAGLVRDRGLAGSHVAGYSLGGRVALGLLIRHPDLFGSATLIGASPGLSDPADRGDRAAADQEWARLLEREGLDSFVAAWEALPLFDSQSGMDPAALDRQRRMRCAHDPAGLARSLRTLGLAAMPDYTPELAGVQVPVQLVVGERDGKFRALAAAMAERLPRARVCIVEGAGHNVVLERPSEIARLIQELVQ